MKRFLQRWLLIVIAVVLALPAQAGAVACCQMRRQPAAISIEPPCCCQPGACVDEQLCADGADTEPVIVPGNAPTAWAFSKDLVAASLSAPHPAMPTPARRGARGLRNPFLGPSPAISLPLRL